MPLQIPSKLPWPSHDSRSLSCQESARKLLEVKPYAYWGVPSFKVPRWWKISLTDSFSAIFEVQCCLFVFSVCPFQPTSWWFASLKTARHPITHCRRTSTTWSTRRWGCRRCRYCKVRDIFQTFFQVGKATWRAGPMAALKQLGAFRICSDWITRLSSLTRKLPSRELWEAQRCHLGGETMKLKDQKETKMRRVLRDCF